VEGCEPLVRSRRNAAHDVDAAGKTGRGGPGSGKSEAEDIIVVQFIVRFTWSARKAASNLKKHGVSFPEAATAFEDDLAAYYPDTLHEDRFILIGYSRQHRLLYVVHAEVEDQVIRIISARKATTHEKAHYEND
jgi:uncharacterized DUF497 family protein